MMAAAADDQGSDNNFGICPATAKTDWSENNNNKRPFQNNNAKEEEKELRAFVVLIIKRIPKEKQQQLITDGNTKERAARARHQWRWWPFIAVAAMIDPYSSPISRWQLLASSLESISIALDRSTVKTVL